ncbi:MAG: SsrA-binding protein SmpB [Chitinophagaceae bacterium]
MEIKNRSAYYDFFIDDKYIAGIVLMGSEVKSIRLGKVSFTDSFCFLNKGEIFVKNIHISPFKQATIYAHDPMRERKLLLNTKEILKIQQRFKEKGYTLVPLRIFFNNKNKAKLEIGLARGKKQYDKRETIKKRDHERLIKKFL